LRYLLVTVISITFIIFFSTSIVLDTPWFNNYLKAYENELEIYSYVKNSRFITLLILSSFLISQAIYYIKVNGENKRKIFQLYFGIFVGIGIVGKLLISYELMLYNNNLFNKPSFDIKAENNSFNASDMYNLYGISIEYYDVNKTKQIYKPAPEQIEIKKYQDFLIEKQHQIPLKITISFLTMIYAYYLGNMLANRKIKKDITNQRSQ